MMLKDVAGLYSADTDKVILHIDSAQSHTTESPVTSWTTVE
jgi:hypothetical protein